MRLLRASSDGLRRERVAVPTNWSDSMRAACRALATAAGRGLTAITVTGWLQGCPEETRLLRVLSRKLAREYGLQETVILEGDSFTACFSPSAADGAEDLEAAE